MADLSILRHADHVAAGAADPFLRAIDPVGYESEGGDVEAPTGHWALVHVSRDMVRQWVSAEGDVWLSHERNFPTGWYIVITDQAGFVYGHHYAGGDFDPGLSADLEALADAYSQWLGPEVTA